MAKKFDIRVIDTDSDGKKNSHEEHGVMANSASELQGIYKMCGQEIQIIREYTDNESQNYGHQEMLDPSKVQMNTSMGRTGLMKVSEEDQKKIDELMTNSTMQSPNTQQPIQHPTQATMRSNEPPKFFTIGGIKCKMENGKFYQKQWIRLSDEESSEIRIVADKTNKICPLKDKHIEIMKWILTEDSENSTETQTNGKVLLNG